MWNFSNGQCLKEFNYDTDPSEVTAILYVGTDSPSKTKHIVTVGWDKHVYIWPDESEPVVSWVKCLPKSGQRGHSDDILSVAYSPDDKLLITGGQDGNIIIWHFETGFPKAYLHEKDRTCLPDGITAYSKSVEALIYSNRHQLLFSIHGDSKLRFWNLTVMDLAGRFELEHYPGILITCAAIS